MRNIVICCDGTGNEISENISNVLKLYRCLRKTEKTEPRQLVFYDPGVGTLARPNAWKKWKQDAAAIFGLATGYGLDDNVLKLYRCLRKTEKTQPRQLVFYDPGVGTLERPDPWHKLKQDFNAILGLATGYGLDDNVLAAYCFLVQNWREGDQIYLFGFSRGAYTVRCWRG